MIIQEIKISEYKKVNILSDFLKITFNIIKSIFTKKEYTKVTSKNINEKGINENLLIENEYLKIKKEYDFLNKDDEELKDKFTLSVLGYTDLFELGIYKAIDLKANSEINNCLFTYFEIKSTNSIILQKIRNKSNVITSELIEVNTNNGKYKIIGKIGNYELYEYDGNTIFGGNKENLIEIKLEN